MDKAIKVSIVFQSGSFIELHVEKETAVGDLKQHLSRNSNHKLFRTGQVMKFKDRILNDSELISTLVTSKDFNLTHAFVSNRKARIQILWFIWWTGILIHTQKMPIISKLSRTQPVLIASLNDR